jgi:hypothetical protein
VLIFKIWRSTCSHTWIHAVCFLLYISLLPALFLLLACPLPRPLQVIYTLNFWILSITGLYSTSIH